MNTILASNLIATQEQMVWLLPIGTIALFVVILMVIARRSENRGLVWGTIAAILVLGRLGIFSLGFTFRKDALANLATVLPAVLIVAILIERTAEIF